MHTRFEKRLIAGIGVVFLGFAVLIPVAVADSVPVDVSSPPRFVVGERQVDLLEAGLSRYERILANGGWEPLLEGPTIRPGATGTRISALAERLVASGDLVPVTRTDSEFVYAGVLEAAVRRFQRRHGLESDGVVGPRTLSALNVSVADRVMQITASLRRARRARIRGDGLAVVINIPAYLATLVDEGREAWTARVIVGSESTPTPEFRAMITEVVLNPAWSVPVKIAAEEIVPKLKANPAEATRSGYVVYGADGTVVSPGDVDWEIASPTTSAYRIVQRPGPLNQLGQVKFLFPNVEDVYLHGTATTGLFERSTRALSHGCVRMQDPLRLAEAILARQGWSRADIDEQLATGKPLAILLQSPVPIDLRYQTVLADDEGTLYFFEDIYGMATESSRKTGDPDVAASGCQP